MNCEDAARVLAERRGGPVGGVRAIEGGWAYWTFEVEGDTIVRFPRSAEVASATERELTLLPRLASRVSFEVPRIRERGHHQGRPFFSYQRIDGSALRPGHLEASSGLTAGVAEALRQLHHLPLVDFADPTDAAQRWRNKYQELRASAMSRVVPLLDQPTSDTLLAAWDLFETSLEFRPVLVHADLGLEHILVKGSRLCGIIDWETAGPGDPAIDFVGLWIGLGQARTAEILGLYGPVSPTLVRRITSYVWLGLVCPAKMLHMGAQRGARRLAAGAPRRATPAPAEALANAGTQEGGRSVAHTVYAIARLVPQGRVVSYGDIAGMLVVNPRVVGRAMATLPYDDVPWWRVTNSYGDLPAHLHDRVKVHWADEGIAWKPNALGCRIKDYRAELGDLADMAEELLGPLPGVSGSQPGGGGQAGGDWDSR